MPEDLYLSSGRLITRCMVADRSNKAEEILDVAERMARTGGYNGFSFREIAKAVGIKAASVHYHFPTKDELGAAVARRYTERFLATPGDASDSCYFACGVASPLRRRLPQSAEG
jgi:AcrR family transcriptional regulator